MSKNVCQYWVKDSSVCSYWDDKNQICEYPESSAYDGKTGASRYPNCNAIGTAADCSKYKSTGDDAYRCVLPDPSRHVGKRFMSSGGKWIRDEITEYNDGQCDGEGTSAKCGGYSPYHMGFSSVQPDQAPFTADDTEFSTVPSGLEFRLPLYYDVSYARSQLSRCFWWRDEVKSFTIDENTGKVDDVSNQCLNRSDEKVQEYWDKHSYDEELGMWKAPCNGCKPECPWYTGVCWEYCVDSKMQQGDKVLAEQVLELRYYLFKENWDPKKYKVSFAKPIIKAWAGKLYQKIDSSNPFEVQWIIDSYSVQIPDFSYFNTSREKTPLTAGTPANNYDGDYVDLVQELKTLPLKPIIRNKFEEIDGYKIFESSDIMQNEIVILGDTFWYGSKVYAVNLLDPELSHLPIELQQYASMFEIEQAWANDKNKDFDEWYSDLSNALDFLIEASPEKIPISTIDSHVNAFYIAANTLWGDNTICVFDKGSGTWEFDMVSFKMLYVSGVLGQTSFSITGEGTVPYLPSYQDDFMGYANKNGEITVSFFPLISEWSGDASQLAYLYNDSVRKRLPVDPINPPLNNTFEVTYKLYKVTVGSDLKLNILNGELRVLGNAGYILVILPDSGVVSSAIKPWEIEGDIYLVYPDGTRIKMAVHEKSTNRLETNQFIVRPYDINEFKQVCNDAYIYMEKVYTYEKRSFGESSTFPGEEVDDEYVGKDDSVVDLSDRMQIENYGNQFKLTGFGYEAITLSAVIKGLSGRLKGQVKTKIITWIKQPYCRDVEINYVWEASYKKAVLLPEYECYGSTGYRYEIKTHDRGYRPPCGDHDLSFQTEIGPMWYPYDDCDDYARYNIIGALTEWDIHIMDPFWDGVDPPHGKWDIRMMGPADNFGWTCDSHAHLWACLCDWSFCIAQKAGSQRFAGSCYYRGGLSYLAKERAVRFDGSLPNFGNVYRDFMRSYRSIENIDYYVVDEVSGAITRSYKWVPAYEFYTSVDLSKSMADYPYLTYSSNDYYDDGSYYLNPFGLYLVDGKIEGVTINEKLDVDGDNIPIRYEFDDVFRTHDTAAGIYYPYPKNLQQRLIGGALTDIITWYTYRDYPGGDLTKSIQWAWQEIWKKLERYKAIYADQSESYYIGSHKILYAPYFEERVDSPYEVDDSGNLNGKHLFLNIEYPDYKYDFRMGEHRLICDEGTHSMSIVAPIQNEDGSFETLYWGLTLNNGPTRCFDKNGNWIEDVGDSTLCNKVLYDTCTTPPWVTDVTIFDTGYANPIPDPNRAIESYDSIGDLVYEYYQRGLSASLNTPLLKYLPTKMKLLGSDDYVVRFDTIPNCMDADDDNQWSAVDLNTWLPCQFCFYVDYCCGVADVGKTINIDFDFGGLYSIGGVVIEFKYGAEEIEIVEIEGEGPKFIGNLYNLPGVTLYKSTDGFVWEEIYGLSNMSLANKNTELKSVGTFHEIDREAVEILEGHRFFRIEFRVSPTQTEINNAGGELSEYYGYTGVSSMVSIECIRIYYGVLESANETIKTYERKYNISYGSHGDFPPHGYDSTGSLLYPLSSDRSTVYQYDSIGGVVGMPGTSGVLNTMNKVRGRLLKETHMDKERVVGNSLSKYESEQKKIHDDVAIKSGSTSFTMKSVTPPGLEAFLNEIGMSFPTWGCEFTNTTVRPLSPIAEREMYSPCGHLFDWDIENIHREYACGKHGSIFHRSTEDVFEYVFRHQCSDFKQDMVDALTAYYRGIGNLLINPFVFTQADAARADRFSNYYRTYTSQVKDAETQQIPGPVGNV